MTDEYTWDDMVEDLEKEYKDTVIKAKKLAKQLDGFISKDRAIDLLLCRNCTEEPNCKDYCAFAICILDLPSADVAPVVHGKWEITDAYPHNIHCSVCHKRFAQTHWEVWEDGSLPRKYCPNCGAKMDLGAELRRGKGV